jgi:type I restriction enzyme S subunit
MNAERLLAHYNRIADAPDAIARLRRFILDLAVRGKLVLQDANDEPASVLLERIANEKARLIEAGKTGKDEPSIGIDKSSFPMLPPANWILTRLASISRRIHYGYTASADAALTDVRMLRITDIQANAVDWASVPGCLIDAETVGQYRLEKGDILIARTGGTIGKTFLVGDVPVAAVFASYLIRVQGTSHVFDQFLKLFLESSLYWTQLRDGTRGTGQPNVNGQTLGKLVLPLPPLAEQHRIVAKVDELMALCDRLEAARTVREATRDRLAAASLARLNAPDPETFQADARFALNVLPALTTRPDQIKQLRQTILNLAVRGKLVPQDPNDEPAAVLLERIAKEKARLVKAGEIRKERALPPISDNSIAFDLPRTWSWVRLGDLSQLVTSGSRDWAQHYSTEGAIFVRMGNLSKDHYRLRLDHIQRVKAPSDGEGTRTRLEPGDILISITGDVGMLGLIPEGFGEAYINQHAAMVRPITELKGRYLAELFLSPFAQSQFNEPQRGIKNSFRLSDVSQFVVPLPPLAEQHRIVAKVDELMALCDRLEASLTATAATRRRLLDALLAEALEPVDGSACQSASNFDP